MPLWHVYHDPTTTFQTTESKASLAKDITDIYTSRKLPAFYVNVLFIPVPAESFFVGGVPRPSSVKNEPGPNSETPFIRVTIQNIARKLPHADAKVMFLSAVEKALKPHIGDKGYDWEVSAEETDRELWHIQGVSPPANGSEEEKVWISQNRAVLEQGKL